MNVLPFGDDITVSLPLNKTIEFAFKAAFFVSSILFLETENIFEEYKKDGLKNNYELVPDSMVNDLCISGTPENCKNQIRSFYETGIDLPILQFNPIGDVGKSFDLMTQTFSELEK